MNTLKYYIRIYFLIVSQYIKARMQYRLDFWACFIAVFILNAGVVFTFWILFHSITQVAGWSFDQMVFLYSFCVLATNPMDVLFVNLWYLGNKIRDGEFIKYYFRPLNMLFYFISEQYDLKSLSNLLFAIIAFSYSSIRLGIQWNFLNVCLLFFMLLGSALIVISMMLIAASIGFWTISSHSIISFTAKFREVARYPATIFKGFSRFIFTYIIPVAFIAFYPSQLFIEPEEFNILAYLSPVVGVIFFILAYAVWKKGVNSYSGTGS